MKKFSVFLMIVFIACETETKTKLPQLGHIGSFSLVDEAGKEFGSDELKGSVWVGSFIFTRCQGPCPMMSQQLAQLQTKIKNLDAKIVSISMDPEYDRPQVMKEYGNKFKADFTKWKFLGGEKSEIINLAKNSFKLPAGEDPDMHSTRFVLVDQAGSVRGYYRSEDKGVIQTMVKNIKQLIKNRGSIS